MPEQLPKPPSGLRAPGRRLWDEVVEEFIPSPGELEILRQAAHTADETDRLERELRRQPFMVEGYNGQPRPNPLFKVVQEHRKLLRQLVDSLNIPVGEDEDVGLTPANATHNTPPKSRWARQKGA